MVAKPERMQKQVDMLARPSSLMSREERRFEDLDALGAQITLDVEDARRALTESCTTD